MLLVILDSAKGIQWMPFVNEERLRNEAGRGTEVVVSIVEPPVVELDLVVVEVQVRRVREAIVVARFLPLPVCVTRIRK